MSRLELENILLEDILKHFGHEPVYVKGDSLWYLSPFREERTPSFQVRGSVFTDWGNSEIRGGVLDLCARLWGIPRGDVKTIIEKIRNIDNLSVLPPPLPASPNKKKEEREKVIAHYPMNNARLINYLSSRGVEMSVALRYTNVLVYMNPSRTKKLYGIGFKNQSGGYELRSEYAKRSFAPKDISMIDSFMSEKSQNIVVFEGFMDALSYISHCLRQGKSTNFQSLILNGVGMVQQAIDVLKEYKNMTIYGLLDRDAAGDRATEQLKSLPNFLDRREWIGPHKDVNDKIINDLHLITEKKSSPIKSQHLGKTL